MFALSFKRVNTFFSKILFIWKQLVWKTHKGEKKHIFSHHLIKEYSDIFFKMHYHLKPVIAININLVNSQI